MLGFLVTMDIEKAFHSLDHFLISTPEKYCFGKNFIFGFRLRVIDSGTTTKYFSLRIRRP